MKVLHRITLEQSTQLLYSQEKVTVELNPNQLATLVILCRRSADPALASEDVSYKAVGMLMDELADMFNNKFAEEAIKLEVKEP